MDRLTVEIRRFVRRYQRALIGKALILAGLGGAACAVVGWRLHRVPSWPHAALAAAAIAGLVVLGWWARRRWLSPTAAVRVLDDALGLKQRLLTASEFEGRANPPALYPLLLQDTMRRFSREHQRLPRLVDRTTIAMALLLLLALLWPMWATPLTQVARRTDESQSPSPQPEQQPPPPEPQQRDRQQQQQQQAGSSQQQGQQGQQAGRQDASKSSDRQEGSDGSQQASGSKGREGKDGEAEPRDGSPDDRAGERQMARASKDHGGRPGQDERAGQDQTPQQSQQSGERGEQSRDQQEQARSRQEQAQGQREAGQQRAQAGQQESQRQQAGRQQQQSPQGSKGRQQMRVAGDQEGRQGQQGKQKSASRDRQQTGGGSRGQKMSGDQQALRAEIQELLHDLQGELQQIQQQLAARRTDLPHPEAGTGTDPDLYGDAETLKKTDGEEMPIQLKTDHAPTSSRRPASGTGTPSGTIARTGPRMTRETAVLSDQPLEEVSSRRRAVPPAYQSVFDSLYQRTTEPDEMPSP